MPWTALGRHEVVVTTSAEHGASELYSKQITMFPVVRIIAMTALLCGILAVLLRPWQRWGNADAWWLVVPAASGVLIHAFLPECGGMRETIAAIALPELCGLSLALGLICCFTKRRRILAGILVLLVNGALLLGSAVLSEGAESMASYIVPVFLISLTWSLPSLLALVAVRRRFSGTRLAMGLVLSWLACGIGAIAVFCILEDESFDFSILPIMVLGLPYVIGYFVFAVRNRLCRAGIIRTFGLVIDG